MDFDFLVSMGYVSRIAPSRELCEKEMAEAEYDLSVAGKTLSEGDAKWAIVKAYYSMFHAAKGVLFLLGLKERSHRGIAEALEALCKEGRLEARFTNDYRAGMSAREGADYSYRHSSEVAGNAVAMAGEFVERMKKFAEKAKP